MTNLTLALPEVAAQRLEALAKARGESLENLAERVLRSAAEQVGGASVLTDEQRAELRRRLSAGLELADEADVATFFAETDRA